jgi:hypothetical protein
MELVKILSKVVKENLQTKKILLEYPESTVKKLIGKFSAETEDTEAIIRQNIADFERFKEAFANEDKDIFRHSYEKLKNLVKDRQTTQKSKKNLADLVQDYIVKYKGQADLQLTKINIKKFFEIKTHFPNLKDFKKNVTDFNPSQLNSLVTRYFTRANAQGINELIAAIAENFAKESPDLDILTAILPRARRFVQHFELIPLNAKLSKYMTFDEFEHIVDGYTPVEESEYDIPEINTDDINIPYEDDNVLIFAPNEKQQCINIRIKYAEDRTWCTSYDNSSNYYYRYRLELNLTLYYVINKTLPSHDLNYASVILVEKNGDMRLADGSNKDRYSGHQIIPWSEIVKKIPVLEGKKEYFQPKPYSNEEQQTQMRIRNYTLRTTDPIAELGGEEEVSMWLELRNPRLTDYNNGNEVFKNLTDALQKKYIGLGNELTGEMVKVLSPSTMSYYVSKKKEKLLLKSLKDLSDSDMEVILSVDMKPYFKALKEKYTKDINLDMGQYTNIEYPNSILGKYVRMFGLEHLLENIEDPEEIAVFQINNTTDTSIDIKIPNSITRLSNLESLILHNCVSEIPEVVGNMTSLLFLNVTSNKNLTTLPASLVNLNCVAFISVKNSSITPETLPAEFLETFVQDGEDGKNAMWSRRDGGENC